MEIVGNGEAEMREGWRGSSSRSHVAAIQHDMSSALVVFGLRTESFLCSKWVSMYVGCYIGWHYNGWRSWDFSPWVISYCY